jgi:oligoribonuclease NrnB/cAMP/cGMP phosphodiesterase (DHH superfamily)
MVDFSYPRATTFALCQVTRSLTVFDHHKTAQEELKNFVEHPALGTRIVFDMERSGAAITWDELHPQEDPDWPVTSRPWYVDYVQDRDLWCFALPDSREINAYLMALPHTIEAWDRLRDMMSADARELGKAIRLHIDHYIEKVTAQVQRGEIGGYSVRVVCAAYPNISDVCNKLCETWGGVGVGWFERGDSQIQFSLRSIGEIDVSAIAKTYGGGGHKNAAGFQLPYQEGRRVLDSILGR